MIFLGSHLFIAEDLVFWCLCVVKAALGSVNVCINGSVSCVGIECFVLGPFFSSVFWVFSADHQLHLHQRDSGCKL